MEPDVIYCFDDFELDDRIFELRRDGELLSVEPKVLDVLLHLVRRPGRLVGKDELQRVIWEGFSVSRSSLSRAVSLLRSTLGDSSRRPRFVATVHGRGYCFIAKPYVRPSWFADPAAEAPSEARLR